MSSTVQTRNWLSHAHTVVVAALRLAHLDTSSMILQRIIQKDCGDTHCVQPTAALVSDRLG